VAWNDDLVDAMVSRLNADVIASRQPATARRLAAAHSDWKQLFAATQDFVEQLPALTQEMLDASAALDHPVLVSAVDEDDLFPLETPLTLYRQLPNARLAILPGRRHALPDAPLSRLADLLREFFE
jgi:pimeloyl-ACP methyl ester carboxylesterase